MTIKRITHTNKDTIFPCPFLHMQLNIESLSLSQGLSITLLKYLYPQSIEVCLSMRRTVERWNEPLENAGQIILAALQDDTDPLDVEVRDAFQSSVQSILDRAHTVFVRARVQSQPELEAKVRLLKELKKQALNFYMDHGGRENKEKIDRAMASACLALTPYNQTVLDNYWKMVAKHPWAGEHHEQLEEDLYKLLAETTEKTLNAFELFTPPFHTTYGRRLKTTLLESFLELAEDCMQKRRLAKTEELKIQLDYLRLRGQLIFRPAVQGIVRKSLLPLLSDPPEKIQKLAEKRHARTIETLESCQLDLDSFACLTDPTKIREGWGLTEPSDAYLEYVRSTNVKRRDHLTQICKNLLPYANFEECLKWAQQQYGFIPDELRTVLSEESAYDRTIRKYFALTCPVEADEEFPDEDLILDLASMTDPVAYFIQRLRKLDEEALALFDKKN